MTHTRVRPTWSLRSAAAVLQLLLAGLVAAPAAHALDPEVMALANRLSWGGGSPPAVSTEEYLRDQLHPPANDGLPQALQDRIATMEISRRDPLELTAQQEKLRKELAAVKGKPSYGEMHKAYNAKIRSWQQEASERSLLRSVYSQNQLKEQLVWFWYNHFNVHWRKGRVQPLFADFEESAIRPRVLGRFKDLLNATVFHPAMLFYLDNRANKAGKINENYARELLELHTMGVEGGYSQKDVQELARALTGLAPDLRPLGERSRDSRELYIFQGVRHDTGDKVLLGQTIKGRRSADEVRAVVDLIARQPATARFISSKLAKYFCCDEVSSALVDAMAETFTKTDGDIAAVLETLFTAPDFRQSLGRKFKDPMHYVVSAARVATGAGAKTDPSLLARYISQLGQRPYDRSTPDGYPITDAAWSGSGAMISRFEVASRMSRNPGDIRDSPYVRAVMSNLGPNTRAALAGASNLANWKTIFFASPEFMHR
ncbi:DUF1800 domain-containing protein [Hansschlegelia zhihuaiae]|uniref:DUF1800 domain-containing protein n=1 Tax=Hansschlegelia zhihuaiae TaxID=405005 RepID=A0A4Q0M3Q2_9HYPH|nr:DUF1800 domain-containing protein [Hansschlegelia zhihuaiae]RXF67216.1 DUF1800 domain-containing protein [Hansschlegelia zhihuaiae]